MNKAKKSVITILFLSFLVSSVLAAPEQEKAPSEISKDEIIQEIKDRVGEDQEILATVPGLKKQKDAQGKEFFTYQVESKDVKLEDLDKNILEDLFNKVISQEDVIETNKINAQAQATRAAVSDSRAASEATRAARQYQSTLPPQPPPRPPSPPRR